MSVKNLENHEASELGQLIAEKAFEHLTTPLVAKMRANAQKAYDETIKKVGLTPAKIELLREHSVLGEHKTCTVGYNGEYQYVIGAGHKYVGGRTMQVFPNGDFVSSSINARDSKHKAVHVALLDEMGPINDRRTAMAKELAAQLKGKSVAKVLKDWPQVASVVQFWKGEPLEQPELTKPFEDLVRKHLLALPAPQGAAA